MNLICDQRTKFSNFNIQKLSFIAQQNQEQGKTSYNKHVSIKLHQKIATIFDTIIPLPPKIEHKNRSNKVRNTIQFITKTKFLGKKTLKPGIIVIIMLQQNLFLNEKTIQKKKKR